MNKSLAVYRQLARAARLAFQGDEAALTASRDRIRAEFARPIADNKELLQRQQMARDVAHILRSNVVQGRLTEKGNYHLQLHKDSELGDNDSRTTTQLGSSGCCGGSK